MGDFILGSRMEQIYDSPMTQTAPRQTASAKLQEALAALKRAAKERHGLEEGTSEHARAIELEDQLTRNVYELAAAIDNVPEKTTDAGDPT
jgi:hypothetical protein